MKSKYIYLISLIIFILNLILKLSYITFSDIGLDEPFTIFHSQQSILNIFNMLKSENNPPIFFLFSHLWIKLFGISPFEVRLPSVIFSSLSAVLLFQIGNKHFNIYTGLLCSVFFTFSNLHLFYAHDFRVYSLFILLYLAHLLLLFSIFRNKLANLPTNKGYIFAFIIVNILLLYSHFFAIIILVFEILFLFFFNNYWKLFKSVILFNIVSLGSFIFYLPLLFSRFNSTIGHGWIPKPIISDLYTMIWRYCNQPLIACIAILILFYGIFSNTKEFKTNLFHKFNVLMFFLPYIFLFIISLIIPVFIDRYLLFLSINFYILISYNLYIIFKYFKFKNVIYFIFTLIFLFTFNIKSGKKENLKKLVLEIKNNSIMNKTILIIPDYFNLSFIYYYDESIFKNYENTYNELRNINIYSIKDVNNIKLENYIKPIYIVINDSQINRLLFILNESKVKYSLNKYGNNLMLISI